MLDRAVDRRAHRATRTRARTHGTRRARSLTPCLTARCAANGTTPVPVDAPQFAGRGAAPRSRREAIAVAVLPRLVRVPSPPSAARTGRTRRNYWLGGTLGFGMIFFGAGIVAWGKYLMPRGPFEEPRALMATDPGRARGARSATSLSRGKVAIAPPRLPRRSDGRWPAGSSASLRSSRCLRSLGPLPKNAFYTTKWRKGSYLTTADGRRVGRERRRRRRLRHGLPPGRPRRCALPDDAHPRASTTATSSTKPGRETWGPDGYVAFSKVCTHAGCPVGLYEQLTEQLLCPCHQSLFDVRDGAQPDLRPGAASASAAAALRRLVGLPPGAGWLRRADRPRVLGAGWHDVIDELFDWIDNRLAISRGGRHMLNKIFPDHWSFMIGEIALYSFIVLLATGVFLTLYFVPSAHDVVYSGPYVPLAASTSRRPTSRPSTSRSGARRSADAPDAPLGGEHLRRLDRRAHAARLLHRALPPTTRGQLDGRHRRC